MIYGRRKTGKSTIIKRNLNADLYFLVSASLRAVTEDDKIIRLEDALKETK